MAKEVLAPIEVLATRVPLIFSKCGPLYGFLACGRPKQNRSFCFGEIGVLFKCKRCEFPALVRLLSASPAMREARHSCVFPVEVAVRWFDNIGIVYMAHFIASDNTTVESTLADVIRIREGGRDKYRKSLILPTTQNQQTTGCDSFELAVVCRFCWRRDTRSTESTLVRSMSSNRQCIAKEGAKCERCILFGSTSTLDRAIADQHDFARFLFAAEKKGCCAVC